MYFDFTNMLNHMRPTDPALDSTLRKDSPGPPASASLGRQTSECTLNQIFECGSQLERGELRSARQRDRRVHML
jgi:hypothetical protein